MKISEPNFWWVSKPSFILRLITPGWNLFISLIILMKNFFINEHVPLTPTICVGNFVIGGQGKTPFVRYIREKFEKSGVKTCVILKGYGGKSKLTKIIDLNDNSERFGDESILHSKDGLTIVSKQRKKSFDLLKKNQADVIILDDGLQNPSIKKDINIALVDLSKGYGNGSVIPFGPLRETIQNGLKKTDLLVFVNSIGEEHYSIKRIKELWKGPYLFADYKTTLDKSIKTNLVIYSGISDPRKFSEGIKNNNRKILKNFILHDHEEIDEKKASAILCAASKKTIDIVTTEKDHARLRNSPKGSQREKLFLISKLAKIVISTDEKLLMEFLASNLKIKLN